MKTAALVLGSAFVLASVVACSGAADSDLFADQPASSSNGTDPGGSSSNGSGGVSSPPSGSSSGGSSTSSSGGSSTSSSSSSSSSSGGSSSGGSSSGGSSSGGSSSGGTWTSPGVYCGNPGGGDVYCTTHTQVCCLEKDLGGGDGNFNQTCESNGIATCATGLAIECDDKTDCGAGQVCCAAFFQNSGYKQVKCANDCTQPLPGSTGVRLCDPDAPKDECDAIGKSCQPSQSLPGYYVCK